MKMEMTIYKVYELLEAQQGNQRGEPTHWNKLGDLQWSGMGCQKKQTPKLSSADGDTKVCIEDSDTEHYR